jgi:hypothetical protein
MKKLKVVLGVLSLMVLNSCGKPDSDLFEITEEFVISLYTTHEYYKGLASETNITYTKDSLYKITPIDRVVSIKIGDTYGGKEYEDLRDKFKEVYKDDKRVKDIYLDSMGNLIIDCSKVTIKIGNKPPMSPYRMEH